MKRVFAVCATLCCLFVVAGCEEKLNANEKTMKEYATNYYNSMLKGTEGLTTTNITVKQLRDARELNVVDYDMSKLASCTEESYVELTINTTDNSIDKITYHLQCD